MPFTASNHNPYYIREHSKRILRGALYNDSKFLADINVMDYSLVCGVGFLLLVVSLSANVFAQVDSTKNELVVGIVGKAYWYTYFFPTKSFRLYSHLYMGQEVGELGERSGSSGTRRTNDCYTTSIQAALSQCHGTLFPIGQLSLFGQLSLWLMKDVTRYRIDG